MSTSSKKYSVLQKKFQSLILALVFIFTHGGSAYALVSPEKGTDNTSLPLAISVSTLQVPSGIGKIEEIFQATGHESRAPGPVILIQDAHAIPDAQRSIQKLIEHFHREYGAGLVALEGASSELDPQVFKSFPDKSILKETLDEYLEKGEITGSTVAAILTENTARYHGIENWELYEEGVALYLKAMEKEPELLEKLRDARRRLQAEKEKVYSKDFLEVDKTLESFSRNDVDLVTVLKTLREKGTGSDLLPVPFSIRTLLGEIAKEVEDSSAIDREIRAIVAQIQKVSDIFSVSDAIIFNQKYQAFRTSQISAVEFAVYLKELPKKGTDNKSLSVLFSAQIMRLIQHHKHLRDIQGTQFFKDFETYAQSVKESLFRSDEERTLNLQTRQLELFEKLARLELSREEWEELRAVSHDSWPVARGISAHMKFYENAEQRDDVFFKNLMSLMKDSNSRQTGHERRITSHGLQVTDSAILIAGGFHTQGLARQFKEKGISYVVVRPEIGTVPEISLYRQHMRAEVSWKDYFEVENGQVNLYKAFVRGARDRLLGTVTRNESRATSDESQFLLKTWRDQILRDLAQKERLAKAHQYTQFLDEITQDARPKTQDAEPSTNYDVQKKWLAQIDRFIQGVRHFQTQKQLTRANVLKLLNPSTIPALTVSPAVMDSAGRVDHPYLVSVLTGKRAETRNLVDDFERRLPEVLGESFTSFMTLKETGKELLDSDGNQITYHFAHVHFRGQTASQVAYIRIGDWMFIDHRLKPQLALWLQGSYSALKSRILYLHEMKTSLTDYDYAIAEWTGPMIAALDSVDLRGKTVLDLGAGDGLLSLIAARKGAAYSILVDYDPKTYDLFTKHLSANDMNSGQFGFITGDLKDKQRILQKIGKRPIDVIIANIGEHPQAYPLGTHLNAISYSDEFPDAEFYLAGGYVPGQNLGDQHQYFKQAMKALDQRGFQELWRYQQIYTFARNTFGPKTALVMKRDATRSELRAGEWLEPKMISIIQAAARAPGVSLRPDDIESEEQLATNIGRLLQQVYRASNRQNLNWRYLLVRSGLNADEILAPVKARPDIASVSGSVTMKGDVKPKPLSRKPPKPSERRRGKREVIEVIKEAKTAGLLLNPGRIQSKKQRSSKLGDELFSYYRSVVLGRVNDLPDWATALREAGEDPETIMKGSGKAASKRFWTKELGTQIIKEAIEHNKINPEAKVSLSPGKITKSKEQRSTELGKKVYGYYHAIREKRIEGIENWKQALALAGENWKDHFERRSEVRLALHEPSTARDVGPSAPRSDLRAKNPENDVLKNAKLSLKQAGVKKSGAINGGNVSDDAGRTNPKIRQTESQEGLLSAPQMPLPVLSLPFSPLLSVDHQYNEVRHQNNHNSPKKEWQVEFLGSQYIAANQRGQGHRHEIQKRAPGIFSLSSGQFQHDAQSIRIIHNNQEKFNLREYSNFLRASSGRDARDRGTPLGHDGLRSELRSALVNEAFQKLKGIRLDEIRDGDLLGAIEDAVRAGFGGEPPQKAEERLLKDYIGDMEDGDAIIQAPDLPPPVETEFGRIDLSYLNDVSKYEGYDAAAQLARDLHIAHLLGLITITQLKGISPRTLTYQLLKKKGIKIKRIGTTWPDWALLKRWFEKAVKEGMIKDYSGDDKQLEYYLEVFGEAAKTKHARALYSAISTLLDQSAAFGNKAQTVREILSWKVINQRMAEAITSRSELRAPKALTPEQIVGLIAELDDGFTDVLSRYKGPILSMEKSRKLIRIKPNGTINLFEVTDDAGIPREKRLEIADEDYPLVSELMKRADIGIDVIDLEYGQIGKKTRFHEQVIDMRELLIDFFIQEASGDKKHTSLLKESERYRIMEYSESTNLPKRRRFVLKRTDPKIDLSHVPEVQEAIAYLKRYAATDRTIEANPWVADIWVRVNDYTEERDHSSPALLRLAEHLRRGNLSRRHRGEIEHAIDLLENPVYAKADRYDRKKAERAVKDVIAFIREHLWLNPEKILFNANPELLQTFKDTREHFIGQKTVGPLAEVERLMQQNIFNKHRTEDKARLETIFELLLGIDLDSAKPIFHDALERLFKLYQTRPHHPLLARNIFPVTFNMTFDKNGTLQIVRTFQPNQPFVETVSEDLARLLANPALNIQSLTVQFDGRVQFDKDFFDYFEGVLTDYLFVWATQAAAKLQSVPQVIPGVLSASYRFLETPDKYQPPDLAPSAHTLTLARSDVRQARRRLAVPETPVSGRSDVRNNFENDQLVRIIEGVKGVLEDYVESMRTQTSKLVKPVLTRQVIEQLIQFREDLERYEYNNFWRLQDIRDFRKRKFIILLKQIHLGQFVDEKPYLSSQAREALEQLLKIDFYALLPPPPPEPVRIEHILYDPEIKGLQITAQQQTRTVTSLADLKDILNSAGIIMKPFGRDPKTGRQLLEFHFAEKRRMTREYETDWEGIANGLNYLLAPRAEMRSSLLQLPQKALGLESRPGARHLAANKGNQDFGFHEILPSGIILAGVFDGYGRSEDVSRVAGEKVKENLKQLFADPAAADLTDDKIVEFMQLAFGAAQAEIKNQFALTMSGTTALAAVIYPLSGNRSHIYILYGGDSRASLMEQGGKIVPLTIDNLSNDHASQALLLTPDEVASRVRGKEQELLSQIGSWQELDRHPRKDYILRQLKNRTMVINPLGQLSHYRPIGTIAKNVPAGWVLLLATDGIHKNLPDRMIAEELLGARGLGGQPMAAAVVKKVQGVGEGVYPELAWRADGDDATALVIDSMQHPKNETSGPARSEVRTEDPEVYSVEIGSRQLHKNQFKVYKDVEPGIKRIRWEWDWDAAGKKTMDAKDIPSLFAYSVDDKLRGVWISPELRGNGGLRRLLNSFFEAFPEVERTHPLMENLAVIYLLKKAYGFEAKFSERVEPDNRIFKMERFGNDLYEVTLRAESPHWYLTTNGMAPGLKHHPLNISLFKAHPRKFKEALSEKETSSVEPLSRRQVGQRIFDTIPEQVKQIGKWPVHPVKRVLIAESKEEIGNMLRLLITQSLVTPGKPITRVLDPVVIVTNPDDLLAELGKHKFDLIMTTQKFPRLSGLELASLIRQTERVLLTPSDVPVVIMSGDMEGVLLTDKQLKEMGRILFLKKPFYLDEINQIMQAVQGSIPESGHKKRAEVRIGLEEITTAFGQLMNAIGPSFPSAGKPLAEAREMIEKEDLEGVRPKIEEALKAFRNHPSKDLFKKAIQSLESFRYLLIRAEIEKQEENSGKKWTLEILKSIAADQVNQARHLYTNHRSELTPVQRQVLKNEIHLARAKLRSEVRTLERKAVENLTSVFTTAGENPFTESKAQQLITYIEVRGVKQLRSELRKAVKDTLQQHEAFSRITASPILDKVWREESAALVRTLGSDSAHKTLDKAGTVALVLSESLGESLAANFVKGIEKSNLETIALVGKGRAAADLTNRLKPYAINVRPLPNLRRSLGKDEPAAVPTGIFDRGFDSQISKTFLPFWIEQENVDNPLVKDYVEGLQIAALLHTAQILQTRPELLKDRAGLRAELLKRLALFEGFDSVVSISTWQGRSGFSISAAAAQAYLEYRSQLRIRQAA